MQRAKELLEAIRYRPEDAEALLLEAASDAAVLAGVAVFVVSALSGVVLDP